MPNGHPMSTPSPGGELQREMAFRFGINVVMYALTGNYKTDQVHVPALLQRLGEREARHDAAGFCPALSRSRSLVALASIAALITLYAFYMRARGAWARGLAFAVLLLALASPLLVQESSSAACRMWR